MKSASQMRQRMQVCAACRRTWGEKRLVCSRGLDPLSNNLAREQYCLSLPLYECRPCLQREQRQQPAHRQGVSMKNNGISTAEAPASPLVVSGYPPAFAAQCVNKIMAKPCERLQMISAPAATAPRLSPQSRSSRAQKCSQNSDSPSSRTRGLRRNTLAGGVASA